MSNYLGAIYVTVGCIVALCVSLWLIIAAIWVLTEMYQHRKDERCKEFVIGQLEQYNRWCGYEFPAIARMCDELIHRLEHGWWTGQHDNFREKLRKEFPKP